MPDVDVGGKAGARPLCRSFFDPTWTLGTMSRTPFRVPFRILLKICLFIDGIDEFEENPTQLAELFLSLSSFPNIKFVIVGKQQRCFGALRRARGALSHVRGSPQSDSAAHPGLTPGSPQAHRVHARSGRRGSPARTGQAMRPKFPYPPTRVAWRAVPCIYPLRKRMIPSTSSNGTIAYE
jgi:hypothetical protein